MSRAIVWFRRDLRVDDHPALRAALDSHEEVVCLFVVERSMLDVSPARTSYLLGALRSLNAELAKRKSKLVIREGPAATAVPDLASEVGADTVFASRDFTPRSIRRDAAVESVLGRYDRALVLMSGIAIRDPRTVKKKTGNGVYKIFTPYHRRWQSAEVRKIIGSPRRIKGPKVAGIELSTLSRDLQPAKVSPASEWKRFRTFVSRSGAYGPERHLLNGSGTTNISPGFRFGVISPLKAAALAEEKEVDELPRQLAWRDFSYETVVAFPRLLDRSIRPPKKRWRKDERALTEWKTGTTGSDVVDAAMRQLSSEGWISNRARMTVASFLTRDLRLDWREGARHFMTELVDGDPAVNAFNWQWVAGTGFDAPAPFWRLDPDRQGERYDPSGAWRSRYL